MIIMKYLYILKKYILILPSGGFFMQTRIRIA
jgi:hypothetical protein